MATGKVDVVVPVTQEKMKLSGIPDTDSAGSAADVYNPTDSTPEVRESLTMNSSAVFEVETDAAPSPPRPPGLVEAGVEEQTEQIKGGRTEDVAPPDQSHSQSRQKPRTKTRNSPRQTGSKTTKNNVVYVTNSSNFVLGNVYHINKGRESAHDVKRNSNVPSHNMPSHDVPSHIVAALKAYPSEAANTDLVLVSVNLEPEGLEILARHIGIDKGELGRIKHDYQGEGITEIVYQTLLKWKQQNTDDNQAAMLNILCEELLKVNTFGSREALNALYEAHFNRN